MILGVSNPFSLLRSFERAKEMKGRLNQTFIDEDLPKIKSY